MMHLSAQSGDWSVCKAFVGTCPYADAEFPDHLSLVEIARIEQERAAQGLSARRIAAPSGGTRPLTFSADGFQVGRLRYDWNGDRVESPAAARMRRKRERDRATGGVTPPKPVEPPVEPESEPSRPLQPEPVPVPPEPQESPVAGWVEPHAWNRRPWAERKAELTTFARDLLTKAEENGWHQATHTYPIRWGKSSNKAGFVKFRGGSVDEIFFNNNLATYDHETARGVIVHEIGHVLAGPMAGHGPRFKAACADLAEGEDSMPEQIDGVAVVATETERERNLVAQLAAQAKARESWIGYCPKGHQVAQNTAPRVVRVCGKCSGDAVTRAFRWVPQKPHLQHSKAFLSKAAAYGMTTQIVGAFGESLPPAA